MLSASRDQEFPMDWTVEHVWFRASVVSRRGSVVHVEYLVRGWEALDHDLEDTMWECWEEGGPVDPREAEYDGDAWTGETDVLAKRAVRVAREAEGGRGARAVRRADARKWQREGEWDDGDGKRVRSGRRDVA